MVLLNVGDVSSIARSFVRHVSHHNCDNMFCFVFSLFTKLYMLFLWILYRKCFYSVVLVSCDSMWDGLVCGITPK